MPYTAIDSNPDLGTMLDSASVNPRHAEILTRARKRYSASVEAEREIREEAELDMRFIAGDQWTEKARRERESAFRPVLTFNKLHTSVQQLANQARQSKPAIQISPADGAASKDTALVFQGVIRAIEYDSSADQAYDIALESAASCGFGFFKYDCIYEDDHSFNQKIVVEAIMDAFSIRLDCAAKKPDRRDAMWAFEELSVSRDSYRHEYGREPGGLSFGDEYASELQEEGWITDDTVRLCRYWEVELVPKTLRHYKGADGIFRPVYVEDLAEGEADREDIDWLTDDEGEIREREVQVRQVMAYMIDGASVLDEARWDGSHIPIVAVLGKEIVVKGKRKLISLIRHSRDPQTLHNYYKTMEAETIALAPKPKWIGAVGQFKTKQKDWQRANLDMAAYLEYDPIEKNGALVGAPTWEAFDPPVQALNVGSLSSADDIKAGTGFFDPSLGLQKTDQSGVAVQKLQSRGDISNFHFIDNLARALKWFGLQLLEIIPKKYDTERELEIVGPDNKRSVVKVNAVFRDEKGRVRHHRLSAGKYSVLVSMGASYETQKAENFQRLTELCQGNPQFLQLAGDIIIENSDIIGADRLARRLRAALPPAIQAADQGEEDGVPPEVQQLRVAVQQLQQQNAQLNQLLKTKMLELESKERQTTQTNQTRIAVAEATSRSSLINEQFERDHDAWQADLERRAQLLGNMFSMQQEADEAERERQTRFADGSAGANGAGAAASNGRSDMSGVKCFLIEEAGTIRRYLRRYHRSVCSAPSTPFSGMVELDIVPHPPRTIIRMEEKPSNIVPYEDSRWPDRCECGRVFLPTDEWQIFTDTIYRRVDTGEEMSLRTAPPGAMWDAWWHPDYWKGPDGRSLVVMCPGGSEWNIDSKASNCTMKDDWVHRCWIRHGEPPNITVDKNGPTCAAGAGSIQTRNWHGFLRNGELVP